MRIAAATGAIIVVGFYLGSLRAGSYSMAGFFGSFMEMVFYGNTFSDLRDFAWFYSAWDHVFWGGRTYLAAVLSFVPRFASHFRDAWALGAMTAATAGFDPAVHPGLRPCVFGESFFNFGLAGRDRDRAHARGRFAAGGSRCEACPVFVAAFHVASVRVHDAARDGTLQLAAIYAFSWFGVSVERFLHPRNMIAGRVE